MDRRGFLKGLFGVAGALAAVTLTGPADALTLAAPVVPNMPVDPAVATDKDLSEASVEKAHYTGYYHRHRRWRRWHHHHHWRRRRYWRRRHWHRYY